MCIRDRSRGVQGSEAKHRTNMEYYKELLKETKQKQLEEEELIQKVRELEKQVGKLLSLIHILI